MMRVGSALSVKKPKMIQFLVLFSAFLAATVYGNGEVTILHHPSSLVFKGHDHLKESILKEVYSASLGFSTEQYSNWDGLFIENPFNLAEAVVTIAVDGVSNIGHSKGHHYPLKTDEDQNEIYSSLERRVSERYPESNSHLVHVNLADGAKVLRESDLFRKLKHDQARKTIQTHLKTNIDEDREFLREIALLNDIVDLLEQNAGGVKSDNVPDVFWFKVSSLHPLADLYGENSTQVKEAKQLLNEVALRISNVFNKIYNGRVLVSIVTSDAVHTRRARNILQSDPVEEPKTKYNLASNYPENYPVIFNIILWFGVVMAFSLLAVCYAIADMDPGRDSIIYRMTTSRLKKD